MYYDIDMYQLVKSTSAFAWMILNIRWWLELFSTHKMRIYKNKKVILSIITPGLMCVITVKSFSLQLKKNTFKCALPL